MDYTDKIAVIGMACQYPGARNVGEFWNNLISGKESIKRFTDEELLPYEINYNELKKNPDFVPARGVLEAIDKFDASFFGYTPNDAALMDPQQRVWLENCWNAFENASCNPYDFKGDIGVFAGGFTNTYLLNNVLRDPAKLENYIRLRTTESFQIMIGNDIANLPTKTAYKFNLRGPAINVQTACSTSLVAIAQACHSLHSYESDICLAGGVCILTPQESGYIFQQGAIPSPDGHCRPFDEKGQGTVFSNGVGVVVLRRLEDAIKEKDNIIAVVDGWALNNDGSKKVSYTAPSVDGQANVITTAQDFAGVSADEFSYIEAHGTATQLGDPIEVAALNKAFSRTTDKKQFCGLGSVKSNIGHTDAAAGVAAFIKICLIAQNRIIPPTLHYQSPNPHINFSDSPFYVVDKLTSIDSEKKLILGVSSFGIGGTNAHVIIEEPPKQVRSKIEPNGRSYILPISAKSKKSLNERKEQIVQFVKDNPNTHIDDLAYTLWYGRSHMPFRSSIVVSELKELQESELNFTDSFADEKASALAFMFPGQGAQFLQMGVQLYKEHEEFRATVDKGFDIHLQETGIDLKKLLFEASSEEANERLQRTEFTQPALFIVEYSIAFILKSKGIIPSYLIGHSIGEYAAACIAEVFDYETGLKLVIKRGQLMQSMPSGTMFAVKSSKTKLLEIGEELFEVAAENAPESCTISFNTDHIQKVEKVLEFHDINFLLLNTSHAFHSKDFNPILDRFADYVNQFNLKEPCIPLVSCLTGEFLTKEQAMSAEYWANQLRNSVLFYEGIKTILSKQNVVFIETGPNAHLSSILRAIPEFENKKGITLTIGRPDVNLTKYTFNKILGNLWASYQKFSPDLNFIHNKANKIIIPNYPFDRKRYWIDYKHLEDSVLRKTSIEGKDVPDEKIESEELTTINQVILIWKELLGVEEVKPKDNFFYIGGTSLMAIGIVDKCKKRFNVDLNLKIFFDTPIVGDFSNYIDSVINKPANRVAEKKKSSGRIISGEI